MVMCGNYLKTCLGVGLRGGIFCRLKLATSFLCSQNTLLVLRRFFAALLQRPSACTKLSFSSKGCHVRRILRFDPQRKFPHPFRTYLETFFEYHKLG